MHHIQEVCQSLVGNRVEAQAEVVGVEDKKDRMVTIRIPDLWKTLTVVLLVATLFNLYYVSSITGRLNSIIGSVTDSEGQIEVKEVQPGQPNAPTQPIQPVQPTQPTQQQGNIIRAEVSADDDAVKGSPNAPVTIIEFSDFECPFCTRFYQQTLPSIEKNYINTGKVKFVYRDFPLGFHANAQKAAEAAECAAEQGKFWEMHNKIFDGGELGVATLKQYATELGLDTSAFSECLDSGQMTSEVQKDFNDGKNYGVSGTPTFFINGIEIVGAQPYSVFEQAIEQEVE